LLAALLSSLRTGGAVHSICGRRAVYVANERKKREVRRNLVKSSAAPTCRRND